MDYLKAKTPAHGQLPLINSQLLPHYVKCTDANYPGGVWSRSKWTPHFRSMDIPLPYSISIVRARHRIT